MSVGRHGYRLGNAGSGLHRLRGALLVQATAGDAGRVANWADRPGGGLVLTGRDGLAVGQRLLARGFSRPVLVDAARYVHTRARRSTHLSESWIEWQRAAGLPAALTDSAFIGAGDTEALCSVLEQSAALGPAVVAVLPLHASWLVEEIDRLCAEVAATEIPVALVIEHLSDPLGVASIVDGLLRLLMSGVPTITLRCDVSAVGALCFGAHAAAVGLRAPLRRGPMRRRTDRPSVLVPRLLRFVEPDRLDSAMLAEPDSELWRCDCGVCAGNELSWLSVTDDPRHATDAHTIAALLRLRDTALAGGAGSSRCQDGWALRCVNAAQRHSEIASVMYGLPPQPALGVWAGAAGAGVGQTSSATTRS